MMYLGILLTVIVVFGLLFLYFIYVTSAPQKSKGKKRFDPTINLSAVPAKWAEVQAMMRAGGPANFKQSIMDGDKIVDSVLMARVQGNSMGERLKNSRHLFSPNTYNELWTAHRIRNKIAHDTEFEGLSSDAQLAVRGFEKALKELRAI
jgi:hypothetical protein